MKTFSSSDWRIIALAGIMWGILEATLGGIIHAIHINGLSIVLESAGVFAMMYAVINTKKAASAFLVACIATTLKLADIPLMGWIPFTWVLRPAVHILLEGIVVAAVCWQIHPERIASYAFKHIKK